MNRILTDLKHQFILPLWNQRDTSVIDTFFSPNAEVKTTFLTGIGPEILKKTIQQIQDSFSFLEFTVYETLQQHKTFIYKWSAEATCRYSILRSENSVANHFFSGMMAFEIENGLIIRYCGFCNIASALPANHYLLQSDKKSNLSDHDINYVIASIKQITGRRLTKREVECLSLWLKGCSIKETAKILGGLSGRTIQTFRENIKRKLNVETYQKLFNLIQRNGMIPILLNGTIELLTEE